MTTAKQAHRIPAAAAGRPIDPRLHAIVDRLLADLHATVRDLEITEQELRGALRFLSEVGAAGMRCACLAVVMRWPPCPGRAALDGSELTGGHGGERGYQAGSTEGQHAHERPKTSGNGRGTLVRVEHRDRPPVECVDEPPVDQQPRLHPHRLPCRAPDALSRSRRRPDSFRCASGVTGRWGWWGVGRWRSARAGPGRRSPTPAASTASARSPGGEYRPAWRPHRRGAS